MTEFSHSLCDILTSILFRLYFFGFLFLSLSCFWLGRLNHTLTIPFHMSHVQNMRIIRSYIFIKVDNFKQIKPNGNNKIEIKIVYNCIKQFRLNQFNKTEERIRLIGRLNWRALLHSHATELTIKRKSQRIVLITMFTCTYWFNRIDIKS